MKRKLKLSKSTLRNLISPESLRSLVRAGMREETSDCTSNITKLTCADNCDPFQCRL